MTKYFDKTFFKFLIGFVAILAISFSITFIAIYFEGKSQTQNAVDDSMSQASTVEFASDDDCLTEGKC